MAAGFVPGDLDIPNLLSRDKLLHENRNTQCVIEKAVFEAIQNEDYAAVRIPTPRAASRLFGIDPRTLANLRIPTVHLGAPRGTKYRLSDLIAYLDNSQGI